MPHSHYLSQCWLDILGRKCYMISFYFCPKYLSEWRMVSSGHPQQLLLGYLIDYLVMKNRHIVYTFSDISFLYSVIFFICSRFSELCRMLFLSLRIFKLTDIVGLWKTLNSLLLVMKVTLWDIRQYIHLSARLAVLLRCWDTCSKIILCDPIAFYISRRTILRFY